MKKAKKTGAFVLVAVLGFFFLFMIDRFHWQIDFFREARPQFNRVQWFRSIIILFSTFLLFLPLIRERNTGQKAFGVSGRRPSVDLTLLIGSIFGSFFLLVFLLKPEVFSRLSLEDGIIEMSSALFWLSAALIMWGTCFFFGERRTLDLPQRLLLLFGGTAYFLLGMEEISWGQRIFGFATPGYLSTNLQQEANLHNLATNYVEPIFYLLSTLSLVVLPTILISVPKGKLSRHIRFFLPPRSAIVFGALAAAYNFDMWENIPTQFGFYGAVIVLLKMMMTSPDYKTRASWGIFLILIVLSQFAFLLGGDRFQRIWEVTEYKEFYIAAGFFWTALTTRARIRKSYSLQTGRSPSVLRAAKEILRPEPKGRCLTVTKDTKESRPSDMNC